VKIETLPVGYGEAHLVTVENAKKTWHILVDAGPAEASPDLADHLRARGIQELHTVWISHAHPNHVDGLSTLPDHFPIQHIRIPRFSSENSYVQALQTRIRQKGWQNALHQDLAPKQVRIGTTDWTILHPRTPGTDLHTDGLVVLLTHKKVGVLFSGDLAPASHAAVREVCEKILQAQGATLAAVTWPHHGDHLAPEWLRWFNTIPRVLLSVGVNPYGLPLALPEAAAWNVLRTDTQGTLRLISDGNTLQRVDR